MNPVNDTLPDDGSFQETIALVVDYRKTSDPKIREKIIMRHMNIVEGVTRRFSSSYFSAEDLRSVGTIAMIKALDRFDPTRGVKFSTYAASTIVGEIKHYMRDKGWSVHVPREIKERYLVVQRTIDKLEQVLKRSPRISEIAEEGGMTVEAVLETLEAGSAMAPLSLDRKADSGSEGLLNVVGAEDREIKNLLERLDLKEALDKLDRRSRMIVTLYYYQEMSQGEIAKRLKISQMHVSRLLRKAVDCLKELLGSPEDSTALRGQEIREARIIPQAVLHSPTPPLKDS